MSSENTTYSRSDTRYGGAVTANSPTGSSQAALDGLAEREDRQVEREDHPARARAHDDDHDRLDQGRQGGDGAVHLLLVVTGGPAQHGGQRTTLLARRDELDDHARELARPPEGVGDRRALLHLGGRLGERGLDD